MRDKESHTVVRFEATERAYHWAQAGPVLGLLASGGLLWWQRFSGTTWLDPALLITIHEILGCVLPGALLAIFLAGNRRTLLANAHRAWSWDFNDLRWLAGGLLRLGSSKEPRPAAGKFNAGQKLNIAAQMVLLPLSLASGVLLWTVPAVLLAWYLHWTVFLIATLLITGHLYLAVLHPSTRRGLSGVFTGRVDKDWAERHYRNTLDRNGAEK